MTTKNTPQNDTPDEVKNPAALLAKNKELLSKMKHLQDELITAQTALEASKAESANWRKQWHDVAVIAPLDASLEVASAAPIKYLRAELLERGILRLESDESGIERPVWYKEGKPATPTDLLRFLSDVKDPVLDRMIRGTGASGGGSAQSPAGTDSRQPAPESTKTTPPTFGLR